MRSNVWNVFCLAALLVTDMGGLHTPAKGDTRADASAASSSAAANATASSAATRPVAQWFVTDKPSHRRVASGLPNFGQLNEHVWRSGQPTHQGFQTLADMHIKTVVNLRAEFPQEKDLVPAGVKYVQIPITDETAPTEEQAKQFLQIVTDPNNWPVLVHCKAGEGRTGVMCALVRYSIDGWNDNRIPSEVRNFRQALFGLIRTPMCGSQQRFLKQWEKGNQPGVCQAWIGAGT